MARNHQGLSVIAVGLGSIFEHAHLPILREFGDVQSIAGVEPVVARRLFWEKHDPNIVLFEQLDEALQASKYDCAVVTTYPKGRAGLLKHLCRENVRMILCEKPLEVSLERLEEIQQLVDNQGLLLVPCHTWAYSPLVTAIAGCLNGLLESPVRVHIVVERTKPALGAKEGHPQWRVNPQMSGGGILLDHGYHCLYLARRWVGEHELHPIEVKSQLDECGVDWATRAVFRSVEGDQVELSLTWKGHRRYVVYQIESNGWVVRANEDTVWLHGPDQAVREVFHGDFLSRDSMHQSWYKKLYRTFLAALAGDTADIVYLNREAFSVNRAIIESYSMM
jgi:predicted dehydrogenase